MFSFIFLQLAEVSPLDSLLRPLPLLCCCCLSLLPRPLGLLCLWLAPRLLDPNIVCHRLGWVARSRNKTQTSIRSLAGASSGRCAQ